MIQRLTLWYRALTLTVLCGAITSTALSAPVNKTQKLAAAIAAYKADASKGKELIVAYEAIAFPGATRGDIGTAQLRLKNAGIDIEDVRSKLRGAAGAPAGASAAELARITTLEAELKAAKEETERTKKDLEDERAKRAAAGLDEAKRTGDAKKIAEAIKLLLIATAKRIAPAVINDTVAADTVSIQADINKAKTETAAAKDTEGKTLADQTELLWTYAQKFAAARDAFRKGTGASITLGTGLDTAPAELVTAKTTVEEYFGKLQKAGSTLKADIAAAGAETTKLAALRTKLIADFSAPDAKWFTDQIPNPDLVNDINNEFKAITAIVITACKDLVAAIKNGEDTKDRWKELFKDRAAYKNYKAHKTADGTSTLSKDVITATATARQRLENIIAVAQAFKAYADSLGTKDNRNKRYAGTDVSVTGGTGKALADKGVNPTTDDFRDISLHQLQLEDYFKKVLDYGKGITAATKTKNVKGLETVLDKLTRDTVLSNIDSEALLKKIEESKLVPAKPSVKPAAAKPAAIDPLARLTAWKRKPAELVSPIEVLEFFAAMKSAGQAFTDEIIADIEAVINNSKTSWGDESLKKIEAALTEAYTTLIPAAPAMDGPSAGSGAGTGAGGSTGGKTPATKPFDEAALSLEINDRIAAAEALDKGAGLTSAISKIETLINEYEQAGLAAKKDVKAAVDAWKISLGGLRDANA